jgi:hypothetical protein
MKTIQGRLKSLSHALTLIGFCLLCPQAYSDTYNFSFEGAITYWTVPTSGVYHFIVAGASGGDGYNAQNIRAYGIGGGGGIAESNFALFENQVLEINIGGRGGSGGAGGNGGYGNGGDGTPLGFPNNGGAAGGGGGASYVVNSSLNIFIVAGGGGGGGSPIASGGGGGGYLHAGGQSIGDIDYNYIGKTYLGGSGASDAGGQGGYGGDGGDPAVDSYIQAWYSSSGYGDGYSGTGYASGDNVSINPGILNSGNGFITISYIAAIPEPSSYALILSALCMTGAFFTNRRRSR